MFSKIIRYSLMLIYLFRKTNFSGITLKKTNNVVWFRVWGFKFLKDDQFVNYMALVNALSNHGVKFNLSTTRKLGKYSHKNIFLRYSQELDPFKFSNYTNTLHFFCKQLEEQKCVVHPKSEEVLYWENKGFMTEKFFEHNISTPKTFLVKDAEELHEIDLPFPYLIKEEHSSSSEGLHKINSKEDLDKFLLTTNYFSRNKFLIAQELLNMRRDLRVILVGKKVVHFYWRINRSDAWRPTASSYGNDIDFNSFPEQWREFIIEQFQRLNISTGAFDIAWRNDDLSTEPLILEVSPNYQPNPAIDVSDMKITYGEYKSKLLLKNSYESKFVDIVYEITEKLVQDVLKRDDQK